jgi:hypothetical protein
MYSGICIIAIRISPPSNFVWSAAYSAGVAVLVALQDTMVIRITAIAAALIAQEGFIKFHKFCFE